MALLLLPSISFLSSSSSPPSIPIAASPFLNSRKFGGNSLSIINYVARKIQQRSFILRQGFFHGVSIPAPAHGFSTKRLVIVRSSSEIDGTDASEPNPLPPPQAPEGEAVVPVESLPLESKLKMIAEQKLRMKLAKKIRLRRKRLVRKRRLRKKGRWPPSKMKKNKNV